MGSAAETLIRGATALRQQAVLGVLGPVLQPFSDERFGLRGVRGTPGGHSPGAPIGGRGHNFVDRRQVGDSQDDTVMRRST